MTAEKFFNGMKGKKLTFCGIGRSNMPLIEMFLKYGAIVSARDKKEDLGENGEILKNMGVKLILGEDYLKNIDEDILFRAPGMPFFLPELNIARENGVIVTSEMEIFFDLCPCKIYGITGSDGKTTTSSVTAEILKADGKKVHLGGNIGRPLLPDIFEINEDDAVVVELSSFQLISMRKSADHALITNLAPNHLDVHKDMDEYVNSKKNIFIHQNAFSRTVLNLDNEITASFKDEVRGQFMPFTRRAFINKGACAFENKIYADGEYIMETSDIKIPGNHNIENYLAAIALLWGEVKKESIIEVAKNFGGVAHRAEFVREINGVKFYNDSIASSPSRAMSGTLSLYKDKIIMIAGGADKNVPFDEMGETVNEKVKTLILVKPEEIKKGFKPNASEKIAAAVKNAKNYNAENIEIIFVKNMEEAVDAALEKSVKGDIVSLCPACTAFDMYLNFEVRGNYYKEIVLSK
ncbi:MAG: UDP-N-acetylmuramoyl-L-alanine--D-glutamate ligase [Ruminococcaceae bacterium]|nr:UDP-N-acetylmuramoyl-L-alanine--D-glutamate ligase [Oscillospiraceae bacterium]